MGFCRPGGGHGYTFLCASHQRTRMTTKSLNSPLGPAPLGRQNASRLPVCTNASTELSCNRVVREARPMITYDVGGEGKSRRALDHACCNVDCSTSACDLRSSRSVLGSLPPIVTGLMRRVVRQALLVCHELYYLIGGVAECNKLDKLVARSFESLRAWRGYETTRSPPTYHTSGLPDVSQIW